MPFSLVPGLNLTSMFSSPKPSSFMAHIYIDRNFKNCVDVNIGKRRSVPIKLHYRYYISSSKMPIRAILRKSKLLSV